MCTKLTYLTKISIFGPFSVLEKASEKSVLLSVKLPTVCVETNAGYDEKYMYTYDTRNSANPHAELHYYVLTLLWLKIVVSSTK